MTSARASDPDTPRQPRRRGAPLLLLFSIALAFALGVGGVISLSLFGRGITAPAWVTARVEASINGALHRTRVDIGAISMSLSPAFVPHAELRDVALYTLAGEELLSVPKVEADLTRGAVLNQSFSPEILRITGAKLSLERDGQGRFNLDLGQNENTEFSGGFSEFAASFNALLESEALAPVTRVELRDLDVRYRDVKENRVWLIEGGVADLSKDAAQVLADLRAPVRTKEGAGATNLTVEGRLDRASAAAQLSVSVEQAPARELATLSPALGWLAVLDAPLSGWLRAGTTPQGALDTLAGTLEVSAGAILPTAASRPVAFDKGKLYFSFEPEFDRLRFSEISFHSPTVEIVAEGQAYLSQLLASRQASFLGQFQFSTLRIDPAGLIAAPLDFGTAALDFRMGLDPFKVEIGQLVLVNADTRAQASGTIRADQAGWTVSLDTRADGFGAQRIVDYWPTDAIPKTRAWIERNVLSGQVRNVFASLRIRQGQPKRSAISFDVEDASIRFLKKLPPVRGIGGHLVIHDNTLTAVADRGYLELENKARVDLKGSVFRIPDISLKPALAEIDLTTNSEISAALEVIDHEPLNLLKNWTLGTRFARGTAALEVTLGLPLKAQVPEEEIDFSVSGALRQVRSDGAGGLVPGRQFRADLLRVEADGAGVSVSGDATLDGVGLSADWHQAFGADAGGTSRVEGFVELSETAAKAFRLGLPEGAVSGRGRADFTLDLPRGAAPRLSLVSDLNRVGLRLPSLGWSKPAARTGRLAADIVLAAPLRVERLELTAPGLTLLGDVAFGPSGQMEALNFGRLEVGDWLDVSGRLVGRGPGVPPGIDIRSGRLALSGLPARAGGAGGEAGPMDVSLARLEVTRGLVLEQFRGEFSSAGGFNGQFEGRVNAGTSIRGDLVPSARGAAIRIRSDQAGEVLRDAGFFRSARGGEMDLRLVPNGGSGAYDGTLAVKGLTLRDAPALASLLSAASIVGILEQLSAEGLYFSDIQSRFVLTPETLHVTEASAVGPSMGISSDGVFDLKEKTLFLRGVISPLYALNGIGQLVTRNREGLFGFNYEMSGPVSNPKTSINPLSILTPKIFRNLFGAAPQRVGQ